METPAGGGRGNGDYGGQWGEGGVGIGAGDIEKGKKPTTIAPVALSEAESAEIVAGQIRFLPDN